MARKKGRIYLRLGEDYGGDTGGDAVNKSSRVRWKGYTVRSPGKPGDDAYGLANKWNVPSNLVGPYTRPGCRNLSRHRREHVLTRDRAEPDPRTRLRQLWACTHAALLVNAVCGSGRHTDPMTGGPELHALQPAAHPIRRRGQRDAEIWRRCQASTPSGPQWLRL